MLIKTDGLIIQEKSLSETDKIITVITREHGVIRAFVKGAGNIKGKNFSGSQLFCYSDLLIYKGRDKYIVNEACRKSYFWNLTSDIEKLALAQYFCELISVTVHEEPSESALKLILNSLYMLAENTRNIHIIKSVFELRLFAILGYMPDLVACKSCGLYSSEQMYFSVQSGHMLCGGCYNNDKKSGYMLVSASVIACMRHIIYSEPKKVFSFEINEKSIAELAYITESYALAYTGRKLKTLDFYKQITTGER